MSDSTNEPLSGKDLRKQQEAALADLRGKRDEAACKAALEEITKCVQEFADGKKKLAK